MTVIHQCSTTLLLAVKPVFDVNRGVIKKIYTKTRPNPGPKNARTTIFITDVTFDSD